MRSVLHLAIAATVIAAVPAAAAHSAPSPPIPQKPVFSYRAWISDSAGSTVVWWSGPDRIATRGTRGQVFGARTVVSGATERSIFAAGEPGALTRRRFVASPDGFSLIDPLGAGVASLWARHRAGRKVFARARIGRQQTLRARVRVAANQCAGLRAGVRIFDLHRRTLLPLRIITQLRGEPRRIIRHRYSRINARQPRGAFAPPRVGRGAFRRDDRFRRAAPRETVSHLGYLPSLPRDLPAGFRLKVTGWAPRGALLGAEGSIPPRPKMFGALYTRGVERVDLTIRRAAPGDWPGPPLGRECRPLSTAATTVSGVPATFGISPEIPPHLYWRDGRLLYTLSGPFAKQTLRRIAESMKPVSGPAG